jgi:hypothetical protein
MSIVILIFSIFVWYCYYGLECAINGGTIGRHPLLFHFPLLWEEVTWLFPDGWERKLKLANGDKELAKTLPGWTHFIIVHILLPFGPFIFYVFFL